MLRGADFWARGRGQMVGETVFWTCAQVADDKRCVVGLVVPPRLHLPPPAAVLARRSAQIGGRRSTYMSICHADEPNS
eukprot:4187187-Pyramimonas_sp.AAC.1